MERVLDAALAAQQMIQTRAEMEEQLGALLDQMAIELERRSGALVALAHMETALPAEPRLGTVELPRTVDQLRLTAVVARSQDWRSPVIDTAANIRSQFEALTGPVVVLGPNNFSFAFNCIAGASLRRPSLPGTRLWLRPIPAPLGQHAC